MMTRNQLRYVLRTILIERDKYLEHIRDSKSHDTSSLTGQEIALLGNELPERFWMVEISLPQLYAGNRSKLGEVLIDALNEASSNDLTTSLLAMRIPSILVKRNGDGTMSMYSMSMLAHSAIFEHRQNDNVW
jgi:hypothetical protein